MEGLNVFMKIVCNKSILSGIKIPNNGPMLSHVLYVDDAIFVGDGTRSNIKNIAQIFGCFQVSHLGVPVGANMSRRKHLKPITDIPI